ncbi:unnamed protein product, partial [Mesorhabditis spiculigera]
MGRLLWILALFLVFTEIVDAKRIKAYDRYKAVYNETTWDDEVQPVLEQLVREHRKNSRENADDDMLKEADPEVIQPVKNGPQIIQAGTDEQTEKIVPQMPLARITIKKIAVPTSTTTAQPVRAIRRRLKKMRKGKKPANTDFRLKRKTKLHKKKLAADKLRRLNKRRPVAKAAKITRIEDLPLVRPGDMVTGVERNSEHQLDIISTRTTTTELPIKFDARDFDATVTLKPETISGDLTASEIDSIIGETILRQPDSEFSQNLARSVHTQPYALGKTEFRPKIAPVTRTAEIGKPWADVVRIDESEHHVLAKSVPIPSKTIQQLSVENEEILKNIENLLVPRPTAPNKELLLPAEIPISEVPLDAGALAEGKIVFESEKASSVGPLPLYVQAATKHN